MRPHPWQVGKRPARAAVVADEGSAFGSGGCPRPGPNAATVLVCAAAVLAASVSIRHAFGLFLQPLSLDNA